MSAETGFLALLLLGAVVLFYTGWVRPDLTALLVLLALILPWPRPDTGEWLPLLDPQEAFSGFGSPAIIMVASLFILSTAIVRTGAASILSNRLLGVAQRSELRLQLTLLIAVTLFSAVVNDTATVLVWMPLILGVCRDRGIAPSRVLLVLAYASLLGGQWTLIGTRSNVVLSDYLRDHTGDGLGFFDFTPVAAVVLAACTTYFVLIGRRLLPRGDSEPTLAERYDVEEYLTEVLVPPDAEISGKRLGELAVKEAEGLAVLSVIRGKDFLVPVHSLRIREGDVLVVQGRVSRITELIKKNGFEVKEELQVDDKTLGRVDLRMVEALVARGSDLEGKRIGQLDLRRRHGVAVLAIRHPGQGVLRRAVDYRLRLGDSLLLVGHETQIDELRSNPDLLLLESRPLPSPSTPHAWTTFGLLGLIVGASATGLLEPAVVIPLAAVLALLLRCVSLRESYDAIDWRALVVLGGMISYGVALEESGSAEKLAQTVSAVFEPLGGHALFAALLLLTVLLTQLIENAAVAVILAPVAYQVAVVSGNEPAPFLLGVAICTSAAFMTPVAHESTILVMSAGGYRFRDYLRIGAPFAAITWIVTVLVLPLLYPLSSGR